MTKKYVLITGGSSGIGFSLAKKFAREGYHLILVASNEKRLNKAARELLLRNTDIKVITVAQDLSKPDAAKKVYSTLKKMGISVAVLINNAGFGLVGDTTTLEDRKVQEMLQVNIGAMEMFCRLYLQDRKDKGSGKILNVASTGAFQPGPYTAAYFASKAFVSSYSCGIRYEAERYGVQVCTLYPGTTKTDFFRKTGKKTPFWAMSSDKVADVAYEGLMKNQEKIIPGFMNRLLQFVPEKIKVKGIAWIKKSPYPTV